MPSVAPRTAAVAVTTIGVVAATGAGAAAAPAPAAAGAASAPAVYGAASAPAPYAPTTSGAVPIPAQVVAYTAAYAAAAAAVAQRQPALRFSPRLTPEEKEVVINVYQYVTRNWPETRNSHRDCADKIAEITGLVKSEIYRFIRDRRMARALEIPINLAVAWERMYRYYHEMENGVPQNLDLDKEPVLPAHCMLILNRILHHLSRHRRHGSRDDSSTVPDE